MLNITDISFKAHLGTPQHRLPALPADVADAFVLWGRDNGASWRRQEVKTPLASSGVLEVFMRDGRNGYVDGALEMVDLSIVVRCGGKLIAGMQVAGCTVWSDANEDAVFFEADWHSAAMGEAIHTLLSEWPLHHVFRVNASAPYAFAVCEALWIKPGHGGQTMALSVLRAILNAGDAQGYAGLLFRGHLQEQLGTASALSAGDLPKAWRARSMVSDPAWAWMSLGGQPAAEKRGPR